MIPSPFTRRRRGFTLIEVMAALVIFGVAIIGYMQSIGESSRIQADLAGQQQAIMLAQNALEEMRFSGQYELGVEDGAYEEENTGFFWRTEVSENEDVEGLVDVVVTIAWNDGIERDYSLATQIARSEEAEQ
jgi:type II secretion system protein I